MAKMKVEGVEEYAIRIGRIFKDTEKIAKAAVYAGANVIADAITEEIKSLPTENRTGTQERQLTGITNKQKADLINGFGLSPMENDGREINTKAGFAGYGSSPTKKYPNGVPNALLMRSVESGTSFRKKTPVIRKAVNRKRKAANEAMGEAIDKVCKEIMK